MLNCAVLCCWVCSDDVNIVAVLKAMGAESDQEVVQLVGPDEQLAALLMASIQVRSNYKPAQSPCMLQKQQCERPPSPHDLW